MSRALLDTDVLIDFLRGYAPAVDWFGKLQNQPRVSVITLAELRAGMRDSEGTLLDELERAVDARPVTPEIARRAGDLRRAFGPSHGTGLADALIAATALVEDLTLYTLNIRHFPMLDAQVQRPYRKP